MRLYYFINRLFFPYFTDFESLTKHCMCISNFSTVFLFILHGNSMRYIKKRKNCSPTSILMNYSYRKVFQQFGCKFYFLFVGFNPPEDIFFLLLFIREREPEEGRGQGVKCQCERELSIGCLHTGLNGVLNPQPRFVS